MTTSPFLRFTVHPATPTPTAPAAIAAPVSVAESTSTGNSLDFALLEKSLAERAASTASIAQEPPQAVVDETVPTAPTVQKIVVVVGHSDHRFAQLMTGVTGTMGETGFKIDPMYGRIAYLFQLMEDGGAATEAGIGEQLGGTQLAEVALDTADQVRALQMHLLQQRADVWDKLYADLTPAHLSPNDVARRMLANERRRTADAVRTALAESGVREFFVPVKLEAMAPQHWDEAERYGDRASLLEAAKLIPATLTLDVAREVLEAAPADEAEALDPAIAGHDGPITLEMSSWFKVNAANPGDARVVLAKLLELNSVMPAAIEVERIHDGHIDRVELDPRAIDEDVDDDFPSDRG